MGVPQGLKPRLFHGVYGTTEVVPFQSCAGFKATLARKSTAVHGIKTTRAETARVVERENKNNRLQ
jgi:hypothetical protein